jgi:predicted GNAT family N-acyltransferase
MNAPIIHPRAGGRLKVRVARDLNDMMQVMSVRSLVYMGEQLCPYDEEYDGNDFAGATHLILSCGGEPVGVVRLRWFSDFAKLERMALRKEFRGNRAVLVLIQEAFSLAARKGYRKIMGHAQRRVAPFWIRHFHGRIREERKTFQFSDYDYVEMEADLQPPADALTIDSDPMVLIRPEGEWDRPGILESAPPTRPAIRRAA